MDLALFITSVLTSFVIFVALVLLFTWLSCRPGNAPVYYPNLLLRGLDPWAGHGRGTRSPGGWLRDAISASEPDVVAAGGVDAAVYLVFLSSVLSILVYSGIVLLPVLLPVAATGGALSTIPIPTNKTAQSAQNFWSIERLGVGNVPVIKWMFNKGQGKTMGSYYTLLNALIEDGWIEEAEELFGMVFSRHMEGLPRTFFMRIISFYYSAGDHDKMFEIFADMEELGIRPDGSIIMMLEEREYYD
ncbi:Pentatricopeptide repeat-containing protein [Zea mays]|uniref:Pentatricopeptide repeat-containing protein n=1 Tax=Zea mays TaxID=4577 RepID=A0A317YH57_MAIZE|nr:Pentatricopeptide repeat-containing protein [Zea mays]